mmetsp:Transcript_71048/g.205736  ORF Transcript_71048/g.205736 Transcript_71048/m.205736 type:complete len:113 (+) Transcript_71048:1509-1847(+)
MEPASDSDALIPVGRRSPSNRGEGDLGNGRVVRGGRQHACLDGRCLIVGALRSQATAAGICWHRDADSDLKTLAEYGGTWLSRVTPTARAPRCAEGRDLTAACVASLRDSRV